MNFLSLIEAKREGATLTDGQIHDIVHAYVQDSIPDYQMSAFLMAVYFRGLTVEERRALTISMRDSGEKLEFPKDPRPLVDKHSTGGVGDKVSLPLAPLLACLGFRVPMISGRGLGITGGTLDKLESIPGYRTNLEKDEIAEVVQTVGCSIVGQTAHMVPADRKLYALRDVTGTVPSIDLITASILSKKLAESLDALILDVKYGCAAFMQDKASAEKLAESMVTLGNASGTKTEAFLNDMNTPLGRTAGNWLEVVESVDILDGKGPEDTRDLVLECAARLLAMTGKAADREAGYRLAEHSLDSGEPRRKWTEMLVAHGADIEAFEAKLKAPPEAYVLEVPATASGTITKCDARIIGEVVRDIGGGRLHKHSVLNHAVGIDEICKPGEQVAAGEPLCRILAVTESAARKYRDEVRGAFVTG
jgi:pyrimidine-nucleoside phosphorylase